MALDPAQFAARDQPHPGLIHPCGDAPAGFGPQPLGQGQRLHSDHCDGGAACGQRGCRFATQEAGAHHDHVFTVVAQRARVLEPAHRGHARIVATGHGRPHRLGPGGQHAAGVNHTIAITQRDLVGRRIQRSRGDAGTQVDLVLREPPGILDRKSRSADSPSRNSLVSGGR